MNINDKVNVGDVFNMTWGYDQTNQNFYQVVKKIGKTMVEIMEVACKNVDVQEYGEYVTFDKNNFIGAPLKKKICSYNYNEEEKIYLNMTSYANATLTNESDKHWVTGWGYGH